MKPSLFEIWVARCVERCHSTILSSSSGLLGRLSVRQIKLVLSIARLSLVSLSSLVLSLLFAFAVHPKLIGYSGEQ